MGTTNSKEDIKRLNKFSSEWKKIGRISRDKVSINNRFLNLLNSKFETLGLNKNTLSTEQYKNKVDSLKGNSKAINNEQQYIKNKIGKKR